MKSVYGWIASSITLIYKLPQIYKIYKLKESKNISLNSLAIQSMGYTFYILHGVSINDYPIISMGSGALFQNIVLILLCFYYKNNIVNVLETSENNNLE